MTLAESFRLLPPELQRQVHLQHCGEALGIWAAYIAGRSPVRYADTVVGMRHEVDGRLPHDALRSARAGVDLAGVEGRYREPVVAMQDGDLAFPDRIEFAYYAVYNCFRRYALGEQIDPWLIVNQALASMDDEGSRSRRLAAAVASSWRAK